MMSQLTCAWDTMGGLELTTLIGDTMKKQKQLSVVSLVLFALLCSFPLADGQRRTKSPRTYNRNAADAAGVYNVRAPDVPTFTLTNVENFSVQQSAQLPDTRLERGKQRKL